MISHPSSDDLLKLKACEAVSYDVPGSRGNTSEFAAMSRQGRFVVFPTIPDATRIVPPVEWSQDPHHSRSWCAQLHSWRFLDVLFNRYRYERDQGALRQACDIALDWIDSNQRANGVSEFAWLDKVVGDRAPFLGYLLRASAAEGLVDDGEARILLTSAVEHAEFLLDERNYVQTSNHGLFQDLGLLSLSSYLNFLPAASAWRAASIERFTATLAQHVDLVDGVYREHSPTYQWVAVRLVKRYRDLAGITEGTLVDFERAMEVASSWLVFPDGSTPPLGDSDYVPAPSWARHATPDLQGLRFFEGAGIASVKSDASMLLVTSAYHTHAHKHADDLGFCLVEDGSLILTEAGKYGYDDSDPARRYALSSRAHNVLLVDGEDFSPRSASPHGSALARAGRGHGWYAIEGSNPLLLSQDVDHRRTFLYRPGRALIVVDRIGARKKHRYTRLFHLGPGADVEIDGASAFFDLDMLRGSVADASGTRLEVEVEVGRRGRTLSGWMFPRYREWVAIPTVTFDTSGQDAVLVSVVSLGSALEDVQVEDDQESGIAVSFRDGDDEDRIEVRPDRRREHLLIARSKRGRIGSA